MIPNKEEINFFEKLAQRQQIVYGSHGDPIVFVTDQELGEARKNLLALMKYWRYKVNKNKTKHGVVESKTVISIPVEEDEGKCWGTKLTVLYGRDSNGCHTLNIKFESVYRRHCEEYERKSFNKR